MANLSLETTIAWNMEQLKEGISNQQIFHCFVLCKCILNVVLVVFIVGLISITCSPLSPSCRSNWNYITFVVPAPINIHLFMEHICPNLSEALIPCPSVAHNTRFHNYASLTVSQSRDLTTGASLKTLHQSEKQSDLCGFDQLIQEGGSKAKIFTKQIPHSPFKEFKIVYNKRRGVSFQIFMLSLYLCGLVCWFFKKKKQIKKQWKLWDNDSFKQL